MPDWKKIRIGDLFSLEKGTVQSSKCVPGKYTFITAAEDWKTHTDFSHNCEAIVYAVAASGSLGRAHYINGKFISSDLCFIMTEKDKKKYPINFRFYQFIFSVFRKEIVGRTKTGTSKEAINQKNFSNYLLPYVDIEHQNLWEKKMTGAQGELSELEKTFLEQSSYLTLLRQSILQEAIEGKLTAEWQKKNPARKGNPETDAQALLEKIKAEKQKLITTGKIRKEKPLESIKPEEVPFELPEGWVWTRLGDDIAEVGTGATPLTTNLDYYKNGTINWITSSATNNLYINNYDKLITEKALKETNCKIYPKGTLIIALYGQGKTRGQISELEIDSTTNQACATISIFLENIYQRRYIKLFFQKFYIELRKLASGGAQPNLNLEKIKRTKIPFPPLAEQKAIVERVDSLLFIVNELEKQISERKGQAEELMQTVLREAFEG